MRLTLYSAEQGHEALRQVWAWAKPRLMDGKRLGLSLAEETRSSAQNRLLHAMLQDIASRREWAGRRWDAEVWKRLLVAAWCRANGEQVMMLPALDGHGVDAVFRRTSEMTKAEVAELIDWIEAWDKTT